MQRKWKLKNQLMKGDFKLSLFIFKLNLKKAKFILNYSTPYPHICALIYTGISILKGLSDDLGQFQV